MTTEQKPTPKPKPHRSKTPQAISVVGGDVYVPKPEVHIKLLPATLPGHWPLTTNLYTSHGTKMKNSFHTLLARKAMKSYEKDLIEILTKTPDSILNLAKIVQTDRLVPLHIMESLDPSVPNELRCRYLLLHAYDSMTSLKRLESWLKVVSTVAGAETVVLHVRQKFEFLVDNISSTLAEILRESFSEQWKEFATAIRIPLDTIKTIAKRCSPECALKAVIHFWLQCNYRHDPPTLRESMHLLHNSETNMLWRHIEELFTILSAVTVTDEIQIKPTRPPVVFEGRSTLLGVQIEGDFKGIKWYFNDNEVSVYESEISILGLHLLSEGDYRCEVEVYGDHKPVSTSIHLDVRTLLDKYQKILIDRYTAQPEVPVDTWPPKSSISFINLALIKQENIQKAGEYGRCTIRGDMDDIINDKESITYNQAMGNLSSGARVLIEGRPGSGKTTFVHKFSLDWANKMKTILGVKLLFLIQLRLFFSNTNIGLHDIIGCYCSDHQDTKEIVEYAAKHNGLGLGFVLDGLDEYQPKDKNAFVFKLIRKKVLPKSVVIVASRPAAAAGFRSIASRQIEVLGFLKPQIRDYIENYQFYADYKRLGLHKYLDAHPNVLHMCYLPIHISMICFLYNVLAEDLPQTETEIYMVFTKFAMLRILYRYSIRVSLETFDDLSPVHKDQYLEVCKLALKMTLSAKQVMRQAEVKSLFATIEEKELFGLITVDNIATMCGFQDVYTFLHLTFQEFLAAYYVSSLEEKEQMEIIEEHGKALQMKQVWKFYCGLVNFSASGSKFKTLLSQAQHSALHRIQCSFESQQPSTCDHVIKDNSLWFAGSFLTSSDFTALAFVISNTHRQEVRKVVLDLCTFGLEDVNILSIKSSARLSLITTLCYHGHNCTDAQLAALKELACSLSGLKVLDVTNTNFGGNFSAFVTDFKHSSLEILKVSISIEDGHVPFLFYAMAKAFFSQCSKFVNVCFSGSDPRMINTTSLPYVFHCNF